MANIIRNAVRYAGGQLIISCQRKDDDWQIICVDSGNGVDAKALDKLFDPFFRIESDRARSTGGTGLGLAIVKSCIEGCGGSVSAKNSIPHGLTILINLKSWKEG
jgi:two-component system, OmpR family, sensor histidine kinase CpxA